jgi:3-carboxy-cis,cis-muconate cycloisomerase
VSWTVSEVDGGGLFDGVLARGPVRSETGDRAWLQALLDAEAALARAQARVGLCSAAVAAAITAAGTADRFDAGAIGAAAAASGNPVVPLVRALRDAVPAAAAGHVHHGATSQDILDTAAMLVAHRALGPLLADLTGAATAAARLAAEHRDTPMAGRTLLQQALPITFGLKAAGWLVGLDEAAARLAEVRQARLAVQLGGAAGTLASLGAASSGPPGAGSSGALGAASSGAVGPAVVAAFAAELGLAEPVLPWHTVRTRPAELAGALGEAAGVIGKIARDVILLAQTEVAEVSEAGGGDRGGSSTLPHKRNPVAAISALACAQRTPGLVGTLLAAMVQEHERAAGSWHAEWLPLTDLLRATGSAAAWLHDCLGRLRVDAGRMRSNLDSTGGLLLAERVSVELAGKLGKAAADDLVRRAGAEAVASGRSFADVLAGQDGVPGRAELARLLDPTGYLGSAGEFVDRALHAHNQREAR